jgi:hypothetical protein
MTWIIDTKSRRRFSAKLAAGLALCAMLALGTFTVPAYADGDGDGHRQYHHNWNGGYYEAPPVVYGSVYGPSYYGEPYYPPPVVYGPGVGFNIRIH